MKIINNWDSIKENGTGSKPVPAGAYKVKIVDVKDLPEREALEVYYDIIDGEYKNAYSSFAEGGKRHYRSYKEAAAGFFKGFITAIAKSNPGFVWKWQEKDLIGKIAVVVYGEEEYVYDNIEEQKVEVKTRVAIQEWRSLEALAKNEIVVPEKKLLSEKDKTRKSELEKKYTVLPQDDTDEDVPF